MKTKQQKSTKKKIASAGRSKSVSKKSPAKAKTAARAKTAKKPMSGSRSSGSAKKKVSAPAKKRKTAAGGVKKAAVKPRAAKAKPTSSSPRKTKPMAAAKTTSSGGGAKTPRLNARQREGFKQILLTMRERLNASINSLKSESLATKDWINMEEDGTDIFDQQFALNIVTSENEMLIQIDEALSRIEMNEYGICDECKCGINSERLKALPFVKNCISCQSQKERPARRFSPDRTLEGFE